MICSLCGRHFNSNREGIFSGKPPICGKCGKSLVEKLFADTDFNEYLDSFLQSRIEKYIPAYNEYYKIYGKKKCPDCKGTGFIGKEICKKCHWVGTIEE